MSKRPLVGFSQRIQLEWLEQTAQLLLEGNSREQIHSALDELLKDKLSVGNAGKFGNRRNTIYILLKVWVSVPQQLESLRDEGLEHLRSLPSESHLPIHWGMTAASYPFFGTVAEIVGRLLRIQGSVSAAQVQRRLCEQLGERETVVRAGRRVLRAFVDWGVLRDTAEKGIYGAAPSSLIEDQQLRTWLVEAVLLAKDVSAGNLRNVSQAPMLFPFTMSMPNVVELSRTKRLEYFRQGLDEDLVALKSR
ncbi:MAG: hypothetical protein MUC48_12100 [Leptolyngbya sp. Prado105]|jgi:hypothetical protein|nr:hypothetical protein [Leptolyngbya sp. Prado105]